MFQNIIVNRKEKYNPSTSSDEFKCIELDSLSQNTGELLTTYNSKDQKSIKSKFYSNDVLYGKLRPYLRKHYHPMFEGVCSSEIWVLTSKILDPLFLYQYIQTNNFNELANISSGSKMPRADWSIISDSLVYYPNDSEMKKIGYFLSLLDQRIRTQNKIIKDYEVLKKTINTQLIGKKNPNTKISECLNCISSSKKESDIINSQEGDYPAFGANGLIRKIDSYDYQTQGISIVKDGAGVGRMSYLTGKYSIVGTQNLLTSKNDYDLKYLYYALQNLDFRKYVVGSGIPHIYFKDYKNEPIYVPENKKMINIISKCLSSIDTKISIENAVLDYLLKQKEYLLQHMFI